MTYPSVPDIPSFVTTRSGTLQSASAADGHGTALNVTGMATVVFTVAITGAGSCTITWKASGDGTNYDDLLATLEGNTTTASTVSYSGTPLTHVYTATVAGLADVAAWQSATSGVVSVTITAVASTVTNEQVVVGTIATVTTHADTTSGGTSAPTNILTVGGKTNDGTAQYQPVPLGTAGQSVIVEGITGGAAVNVAQSTATNLKSTAVIQSVSGTALVADMTNSELRVSTYVKTTNAGDTALTLGQAASSGSLPVTLASTQTDQAGAIPKASLYVKTSTAGDTVLTLGQSAMATSLPVALANNQSALSMVNLGGTKATYTYAIAATSPYSTPTDWIVLRGSASKTVKVWRVELSGAATAATEILVYLYKHTTANTSGTSTTPTPMQHDSADSAASATILLYTVAPTIAGSATLWRTIRMTLALAPAATTVNPDRPAYIYTSEPCEPLTLRGVAQELAINFGGAGIPAGGVLDAAIVFSEE